MTRAEMRIAAAKKRAKEAEDALLRIYKRRREAQNAIERKMRPVVEAAGFVFLRGGWVRREAAPRLQAQVDKAVKDAAETVERIKGDEPSRNSCAAWRRSGNADSGC